MRILALVNSCGECGNRQYYSGGVYNCKLVDEQIRDDKRVAPFCPLAHYPSDEISSLEATVQGLQKEKSGHGLHYELFSFIAAKLKTRLSSNSRLIHLMKQVGEREEDLYLVIDRITKVDIDKSAVYFLSTDSPPKTYVVFLGLPCRLCEVVTFEGQEMTTEVRFKILT